MNAINILAISDKGKSRIGKGRATQYVAANP